MSEEQIVKAVENLNEGKSPGRFILWYQLQNILLEALAAVSEDENGLSLGCDFQCYSFDNSTGLIHATFKSRSSQNAITTFTKTCRLLLGADGIRSTLRPQMLSRSGSCSLPAPGIKSYKHVIFRALIDAANVSHT